MTAVGSRPLIPIALPKEPARLPSLDALGSEYPPYCPIFKRTSAWIDKDHEAIALLPTDGALLRDEVNGYLRPADALTLYELAYFARGDVLELGSAWGLSTSIMGRAVRNSGRNACVVSIEIDPNFLQATAETMAHARLQTFYRSLPGDAADCTWRLNAQKRQFGMVFVDHDHSYEATAQVCGALVGLLAIGGIAVFHDFNDERNRNEPAVYGVYRAVCELVKQPGFTFAGVIGCCGLVQRSAA